MILGMLYLTFLVLFLQNKLKFNPAALLPGAAPPVKEPEPVPVGFDSPPEAKTLQSANKVRCKL